MELCFTKKQILSLLEQDATADPTAQAPTAGTSDKQAGGQGYPEVGKWESGIERGPANQVGVTKWADVVGSKLNRGKANQLKEQEGAEGAMSDVMNNMGKFTPSPEEYNLDNFLTAVNWDDWGQWSLTIGSIAAAFLIPGAQGLGISVILDLTAAADQYFRQNDNVGAGVSTALAFVPIFGEVMKVGKLSEKSIANLINKFGPLKTKQQVLRAIQSLPERSLERYTIEQILNKGPKEISRLINGLVKNGVRTKREATSVVKNINKLYSEGKLTKQGVKNMFSKLGLQRFAFDIGVSGQILFIGSMIGDLKNKENTEKLYKNLENRMTKPRIMRDTTDVTQSDLDLANDH